MQDDQQRILIQSATLINGVEDKQLAITDRGLLYGDGFFTTLQVFQGKPLLWKYHFKRLVKCARALFGDDQQLLAQEATLQTEIQQLIQKVSQSMKAESDREKTEEFQSTDRYGIRITYTRGSFSQGYLGAWGEELSMNRIVQCFHYPKHYLTWHKNGIHVETSDTYLGLSMPQLVGLKTLNRLEQVLLKQELSTKQADDLLVTDVEGNLLEASAANIFWRIGSTWYTPSLKTAGIHGTVRAALLDTYPTIQQVKQPVSILEQADEAFICNALLGQVGLRRYGSYTFPKMTSYEGWCQPHLME